jgi:ADP-heptose:LPS heptosyltransferase
MWVPKKVILQNNLSPGDVVVSTAAVCCLHEQYPDCYLTSYRGTCREAFENNPHIVELDDGEVINLEYPLIHQSHLPVHFMQGYTEYLGDRLGINLKLTVNHPQLYLSDKEKRWAGRHEELFSKQPYILVNAGYKDDYVTKKWLYGYWQKVCEEVSKKIKIIQIGSLEHNHPALPFTVDQRGKTNHRELMRMIWHPDCKLVITGESYPAHVAAAFRKPCIVLASGFLPAHWISYPTTRILSVHGSLPCNQFGACWKGKLFEKGNGDRCSLPMYVGDEPVAKCMAMITPQKVIDVANEFLDLGLGTITL